MKKSILIVLLISVLAVSMAVASDFSKATKNIKKASLSPPDIKEFQQAEANWTRIIQFLKDNPDAFEFWSILRDFISFDNEVTKLNVSIWLEDVSGAYFLPKKYSIKSDGNDQCLFCLEFWVNYYNYGGEFRAWSGVKLNDKKNMPPAEVVAQIAKVTPEMFRAALLKKTKTWLK